MYIITEVVVIVFRAVDITVLYRNRPTLEISLPLFLE